MLTVKELKALIENMPDDALVGISFNGCRNSGELLGISETQETTWLETANDEGWFEEDERNPEEVAKDHGIDPNAKVVILYSDREDLW